MATAEQLKARACARIERRKDEIVAISDHIMRHPEPGYRETRTAKFVAGWFGRMGLDPAKAMAMTVVDLLSDGAREARRVKAEAGPKLSREKYLGLARRFGSFEEYPGA